VNLTRDWDRGGDLSEYLVTPTIKEIARRVVDELEHPNGARAWSITGPYGSGKSAFGLFLADVLAATKPSHPESQVLRKGRKVLRRPFVPVLVVAERGSLVPVLVRAIGDALKAVAPAFSRKLARMNEKQPISGAELSEIALQAAKEVGRRHRGGLVLIVDELGKFLEFASSENPEGDVHFLQQLAEAAARSAPPILFATILHSAFADYLPVAQEVRRIEWQKVQGRFQDVPFQLPTEQLLALVGCALERRVPRGMWATWKASLDQLLSAAWLSDTRRRLPLQELLPGCLPLHAITALLLWPVFRSKVAQNERSLFAFLTSEEPYGFQEFLKKSSWSGPDAPLYRVADLYDYVASALGLAAFTGEHARKWALVDHALNRIPAEAPGVSRSIVKTIGLLSVYGPPVGLQASLEAVTSAVGESEEVDETIRQLEDRSVIVYRRHLGGFALWEGSDVDLEAAYENAKHHVQNNQLHARLKQALSLRAMVARAHYVESGTLRVFDIDVVQGDGVAIKAAIDQPRTGDGRVLFVLPGKGVAAETIAAARDLTRRTGDTLLLVAIPKAVTGLEEALHHFECWNWVKENVPDLQGDAVARHEVQARLAAARERLERIAGRVFGLPGHLFEPSRSVWIQKGRERLVHSPLAFQRWLSQLCNRAFPGAPRLHNELLNRQNLSSAAAAARRNLLACMVTGASVPRLGIDGTPPEASMYESMLRAGGFHRVRKGIMGLGSPLGDWKPTWALVETFVHGAKAARRPVAELFSILRAAPYGMRDGPIPVLLAAVLESQWDEIALYEEGGFVPELRIEVLERLTRRPETFELQSHRLGAHQRRALQFLEGLVVAGDVGTSTPRNGLLAVVKSLVLFAARLNPYVKQTTRLALPESAAVRDYLLRAGDPRKLVFEELPLALGMSVNEPDDGSRFARRLQGCLRALSRAYPQLLDDLESQIRQVFDLKGPSIDAMRQLQKRAAPLVPYAVEQKLQLFVKELTREHPDRDWREVVGRVVNGGLPPSHWKDADIAAFQVRLLELAGEFFRLEELVIERHQSGVARVLRIGVLDGLHRESRAVVPVDADVEIDAADLAIRVRQLLDSHTNGNGRARHARLAALVTVAESLLTESGGSEASADA
jgi:hypothetical protein